MMLEFKMSSLLTLSDREANYSFCVANSPTDKKLVWKQIAIDEERAKLNLSLRWYTKSELKKYDSYEIDELPEQPREPLAIPDDDTDTVWAEEDNYVRVGGGKITIKLDAFIQKLQALREHMGGNAPVWHVEFGGLTETTDVQENDGSVCIS